MLSVQAGPEVETSGWLNAEIVDALCSFPNLNNNNKGWETC